jgi:hypothetical protein
MAKKAGSLIDSDPFASNVQFSDSIMVAGAASAAAPTSSTSWQPSSISPLLLPDGMFCPRQISFTIPGKVGVLVTVTENQGKLEFVVDQLGTGKDAADLKALFFQFNESKLATLKISGGDGLITDSQIQANKVIDLGQGANLNGKVDPIHDKVAPFDVGIAFGVDGKGKNTVQDPVHFTLSDKANDLTLDDIAHLQFGARLSSSGDKIVANAPAAPDAHDDTGSVHEDTTVQIFVLDNDTDADGTASLKITDVHQEPGAHGTIAIAADGKSLFYTPDKDFAGLNTNPNSVEDSFVYCVSDGKGGEDQATVNIHVIPVADQPNITFDVLAPQAGDPVNEVRLHVTATTTDTDGSETISALNFGQLPDGVTLTQGAITHSLVDGIRDSASEDVQLFLPTDHTSNFDLQATAVSNENGNGDPDTASITTAKHIELDVGQNSTVETFQATNQSIWDPSLPGGIDDDRFIGLDVSGDPEIDVGLGSAGGHYELKVGFQSTLHATLGDIDATLPYDISIDTLYNKTTDTLQINPSETLGSGGSFETHGPGGSYSLDFVFHALISAHADVLDVVDIDATVGPVDLGFNLFSISSDDAHTTVEIPPGDPVATLSLNFPKVDTTSQPAAPGADTIHSDGTSPDIINLNVDAIALALAALGISPNPLDLGVVDLLSLTVDGGINVTQHFDLKSLGIDASLKLEDNTVVPLGQAITNASSHDANHDGVIGADLVLTPNAQLTNQTDIGAHVGAALDLLKFPDPIGTLVPLGGDFPVGEIPIYDNHFALNFGTHDYQFVV